MPGRGSLWGSNGAVKMEGDGWGAARQAVGGHLWEKETKHLRCVVFLCSRSLSIEVGTTLLFTEGKNVNNFFKN